MKTDEHKRTWMPKLRASTYADRRTKRKKTRQTKNKDWKKEYNLGE